MKSLDILLREYGFDTSFYKEDIMDNEYILRSNIRFKEKKAQKNLQYIFFGDHNLKSIVIEQVIEEFLDLYNNKEKKDE